MKAIHLLALSGLLAPFAQRLEAGSFSADFNDGLPPPNTSLHGNGGAAVVELSGGVDGSGCLKLTKAVNSQEGSFLIWDLDNGAPVNSLTARWKMRVGGGSSTPADGFSFCVANDLPEGVFGEEGAGTGLRVIFDIYDNGGGEAPAVDISWGGTIIRSLRVPIGTLRTGDDFVDVEVKLDPDGTIDVTYNGQALYSNFAIRDFTPIEGAIYGFGGRTGGLNENQWIDDLTITTTTGDRQPGIHSAPDSTAVIEGFPGYFRVIPTDPLSGIQWEVRTPGSQNFSAINGATSEVLWTSAVTPAMDGTEYRAVISLNGATVTTEPAVLTVVTLPVPGNPLVSYNFNNGNLPAGTITLGDAQVVPNGGVGNSGYLQLTDAAGGLSGVWRVPDPLPGLVLGSFFASFKLNMTPSEGVLPADGFGFFVSNDLPEEGDPFPQSEEPRGTGLSVVFDVYNNHYPNVPPPVTTDDEAPSIEVYWNGALVGSRKVTPDFLDTEGGFADVRIRVEDDGTIDVAFNGVLAFHNLPIPGITPAPNTAFALAARTGGAWQLHGVDDFALTAEVFNGSIAVVDHPDDVVGATGLQSRFSVATNDPDRSSYQWQRRDPGSEEFVDIPGATSREYLTPPLTAGDNGAAFRARVSSTNGTSAVSEAATLTVVPVSPVPANPQVVLTFDDGTTANSGSLGNAVTANAYGTSDPLISLTGGTNDSGVLRLTEAANDQNGTLFIADLNNGIGVGGVIAVLDVLSGGGTNPPADGWSFSWGEDIEDAPATGQLEQGIGSGLRISFDIWNNGTAEDPEAPAIDIFWRNETIAHALVPMSLLTTGDGFERVFIEVTPDGKVTVVHDGVVVFQNVQLPGYHGIAGANFAIAGRTGGANQNQWIDNVTIHTTQIEALAVNRQPVPLTTVLPGSTVTLSVEVNDPLRTTFQWERQLPGGEFTAIPGATASEYTTPPLTLAENGARYRCVCTNPQNSVTSAEAIVQVVDRGLPAVFSTVIDFNDGQIPAGGQVFSALGSADVIPSGGVNNSAYLQLTDGSITSETSSFILEDLNAGDVVGSFVTRFYQRIGDAPSTPADGMSFSWGREIPDAGIGEGGAGVDLVVTFDIYDNVDGNPNDEAGEAPAIRLVWRGSTIGNVRVPLELLLTESEWAEVVIRVNSNATVDVIYGDFVAFWQVPLPGFGEGIAGARFAWGARTGGLAATQAIDDISLSTSGPSGPAPVGLIDLAIQGDNLVITYEGTLETAAPGILSGWTPVPGASSPYSIPLNSLTGTRQFWRSVVQIAAP